MSDVALLQQAAEDASWLVERGYPPITVSDFVATHRGLDAEQRRLLACNARLNAAFRHHIAREMDADDVRKRNLAIDTSSVLGTVSRALAGGPLLESSAGVHLDPAWARGPCADGVDTALAKVAAVLDELRPAQVRWLTTPDTAASIEQAAAKLGKRKWKGDVVVAPDVPGALAGGAFVVSCDPVVLDACATWVNVVGLAIAGLDGPRLRLNP